jgi:ATP/maltotriose-dependent transcriptional regulator MalT
MTGNSYYGKPDYYTAEVFFNKSKNIYLKLGDTTNFAKMLANIGVLKEMESDLDGAVKIYMQCLEYFKNDSGGQALIYNNLGIVYQKLLNPAKSLNCYHKSLQIKQHLLMHNAIASTYTNIGSVFDNILNNKDSALFYYKLAQSLYNKIPLNNTQKKLEAITVATNIGDIYTEQKKYTLAKLYLTKALDKYRKYNNKRGEALALKSLAKLYYHQKQYKTAEHYADTSLYLMQTIEDKTLQIKLLDLLAQIKTEQHNYKDANTYLVNLIELKDSVLQDRTQNKIAKLEIAYKIKDKNQRIQILQLKSKNLQKKNLLQLSLISILLIILTSFYFFFKMYKKKQKLEMQEMRRDIQDYIQQLEEVKETNRNLQKEKHIQQENNDAEIIEKLKKFELTDREIEVMLLISKGYKNAEIAEKMFVSINTIKTHTKNIFIKLDVRNRIEASRKAKIL